MKELLDYFKAVLVNDDQKTWCTSFINTSFLENGIITDFTPTQLQRVLISSFIKDNNVRTLFSRREAEGDDVYGKIIKQLSHYGATYLFDSPETVMNIEGYDEPITLITIRGVTRAALQRLVDDILYANQPAKDTESLVKIMANYNLDYRINEVRNNELRVQLFNESTDTFTNGDDAVRYIVFKCTKSPLLIKSEEVIELVGLGGEAVTASFLERHLKPLARCFNRHKRILVALKVGSGSRYPVAAVINRIARLSKKVHEPIGISRNKTFISDAVKGNGLYSRSELDGFSIRDQFRYLNLIQFKRQMLKDDIFIIRNGKTWVETDRPVYDHRVLEAVEGLVLDSVRARLSHLRDKIIVLPKKIDYGLPTTRKQTVGHLPFGTEVMMEKEISSGIYWKNDWGATDLDLSTVDEAGNRVGWGQLAGYTPGSGIRFSGDVVGAPNGAMEFLTSHDKSYGLFVNIFRGSVGCEGELLVGERSSDKWIDRTEIREKFKLRSRGNLIGFVDGARFTVFLGGG